VRARLQRVPGGKGLLDVMSGWDAAGAGRLAAADRMFDSAARATPDLTLAWEGAIRVRLQANRLDDAERMLDLARDAGLDPHRVDVYEAYLAAARGDGQAARDALARIGPHTPGADPVLVSLRAWSARQVGER
jgi:hypothetical protein